MNSNSNTCQINDVPKENLSKQNVHNPRVMVSGNKIYSNYSVKQISSGSETDVSTSTENLSPEEHYVLKTSTRQEPQGEETYLANDCLSLNNTLIIHENNSLNNSMYSYMSPFFYGKRSNVFNENINKDHVAKNDNFYYHNHSISDQPNIKNANIGDKNEILNLKNNNVVSIIDNDSHYSNLNLIKFCNVPNQTSMPKSQLFINNESVIKLQSSADQNNLANTDPSINLQQPMLNNYLNSLKKKDSLMMKNFNVDNLPPPPPPPEYEKPWNAFQLSPGSKSYERLAISRSHPDLSKFGDDESSNGNLNGVSFSPCLTNCGYNRNAFHRNNTFEMLLSENSSLRAELDLCLKKVQKLQKFELEIQKVHQAHEELMRSSEKKEKLERAIRCKLEIDSRRLQEENRCLKDQIESNITKRTNYDDIDAMELKNEISKREHFISRLLTQNKELIADKERQEIELQAQRLTLQEQRNHIEILDSALMNAQNNIITLETELRKKQGFEEKTLFLKKALSNLQLANERRLQMEKRVRTHLEKEIDELKKQNSDNNASEPVKQNENDIEFLKKTLREYEEKIISLEAEVSKWEQKYLEESTLRSIEVSAASAPKDAKIAALERTSQESEKLIAEARSERLKHMDEIHLANKKFTELESKLKDVESKLAEKDAMIKVLQKHSEDRDAVLQKTMLVRRFPNRHTRSASTMGLVVSSSNPTSGSLSTNPNISADILAANFSKQLVVNSNVRANCPVTSSPLILNAECSDSNLNIDEQLKEIDSRLSNKDSIIKALRNEKERYPNHYNNWRL